MKRWFIQTLIAVDQLINTILGGWADETFSARCYRENWYRMESFIDAIFFWELNHCKESYISEQERRQLPPEYRS